jgi:hypothetical protein
VDLQLSKHGPPFPVWFMKGPGELSVLHTPTRSRVPLLALENVFDIPGPVQHPNYFNRTGDYSAKK